MVLVAVGDARLQHGGVLLRAAASGAALVQSGRVEFAARAARSRWRGAGAQRDQHGQHEADKQPDDQRVCGWSTPCRISHSFMSIAFAPCA
jgi:hypothetical protein